MHIDPDEYARRFPQGVRHRSPARKAARVGAFALAWIAAIGVGALGSRWLDDNGGAEAAFRKLIPQPSPHLDNVPAPLARAPSKAELPYDGAPPPAAQQVPLRAAQSIETPVVRDEPPASRPAVKAVPDTAARNPDAQAVAAAGNPAETSSGGTGTQAEQAAAGGPAVQPDAAPKPAATKAASVEKPAADRSAKAARPAKKSSSATQKIARGREISRIQQQAADELKKKTRKRRARVEQAKAASKPSLHLSSRQRHVRQVLARCERMDSLFRREQCKWRVCDGQWGKNGCPSYVRGKVAID
jgi:hypothetical protein